MMNNWLTTTVSTKVNAYTQISEKTGMAVAARKRLVRSPNISHYI